MILSFTTALPIILSLLSTQSMAQKCYYGPVDKFSNSVTRSGLCQASQNNKNLYFCGPTGASIEVKPAQPKAQIVVRAGFVDAAMMVTCDGLEMIYGCQAGGTRTLQHAKSCTGMTKVESLREKR